MVQNPYNWSQPSIPERNIVPPSPVYQWQIPENPFFQWDPYSQQFQSLIPLYQLYPMYNPADPRFQQCRSRCYLAGLTPGTPSWINCVHSCMRM